MTESEKSANSTSIRLLGACRIKVGGREIVLRRKPKQLVKLLALATQQCLHREQIVEILWREQEIEAATNNLHKTIHAARRAFEPDLVSGNDSKFILTKEGQIILTAPDGLRIDVTEFERRAADALKNGGEKVCEAALALYAGDLLPEDLYEDWASERRESLRQTRHKLFRKLGEIYESDGRFEQSAAMRLKLVAADELDEMTRRDLMKIYALGGNRGLALKQFEICRAVLKSELGVEPERETRELFEQIAAGELPSQTEKPALSFASKNEKSFVPQSKLKTNLPHRLTSFIGREKEIVEIKNLLEAARLLTLTGAGGIGKTRLAQKIAAESIEKFTDGAWFIELAALNDSSLIAGAAANALGVSEESNRPIVETLREFLRDKNALLVFDNCEHLIVSCARLIGDLLEHCPHLRVLATSREALDAEGEIVWRVSALSLPEEVPTAANLENLREYEAVRLFVERAKLNNPNFALTASNASAIAQICRRLDGIPLALELAAARARIVSPETIAARLDDGLQLLSGGGRNIAPRHQTLRAAIDWSYRLLSENEKSAWRDLSVFAGGFTLDATEFVCESKAENSALDLLTSLTDKSIVTIANGAENELEIRYSLLETLRQYALEKLRETGEETAARKRHFDYFLQFVERVESEFSKPERRAWFARLETEIDNLRAALEFGAGEDAAEFLILANALWHFWQSSGRLGEGRRWLETALENSDAAPAEVRVKALHRLGGLMILQCDYVGAAQIYERGLDISRAAKDEFYTARILANLGFALVNKNEFKRAEKTFTEALQIFRELQDENGAARTLNGLGTLCFYQGDLAEASRIYADALEIFRRADQKVNVIGMLQNLGATAHLQRNLIEAEKYLRESLRIAGELGERRWINQTRHVLGYVCNDKKDYAEAVKYFADALTLDSEIGGKDNAAHVLEGISCTAAALGKYFRALKLAAFADFLREQINTPRSQTLQNYFDDYWTIARRKLKSKDQLQAESEARLMSFDEAVEYALQDE
ncbi:MAG: AfsR/SARP family transcriptional regulator [Pyrinomonadaceae bacterium]